MHFLYFQSLHKLSLQSYKSLIHSVIICSFTSYVLIFLFKLFVHLSYYCRWINELYRSLFYSCACVPCLFSKIYLNFVDGNKVVDWRDYFSHDDQRGKVLLGYVGLLISIELRHLSLLLMQFITLRRDLV